jgi:hypothetical protein
MGFSGKTLTLEEMTNLVQTTLAIEILYYIIIFCIKASILFFYLRIGKLPAQNSTSDLAKTNISCRATFRAWMQDNDGSVGCILWYLRHLLLDAMHSYS